MTSQILRTCPDQVDGLYARDGRRRGNEAGSRWLSAAAGRPEPEPIVSTIGAHAAIMAVIAATTAPGDKIAFEELTYSLDRPQRQPDRPRAAC